MQEVEEKEEEDSNREMRTGGGVQRGRDQGAEEKEEDEAAGGPAGGAVHVGGAKSDVRGDEEQDDVRQVAGEGQGWLGRCQRNRRADKWEEKQAEK